MRKLILTTLALAVLAAPAAAQTSANADATVRAHVYAALTITSAGNPNGGILDLGMVSTAGGNLGILASDATNSVLFVVGGEAGAPITVTTTVPATLTGPGAPIPLTPNWLHDPSTTNPGGAGAATLPASVTLSPMGAYYMWLGATVTIPNLQAAGLYSGTVNVAVAYQ